MWKDWLKAIKGAPSTDVPVWVDKAWVRLEQMAMPLLARRFHGFDAFIKDLYQQGLAIGYQMAICDRATHPELPVAVELDANQKAQLHDAVQRHMSKMGKIFEAACRGTLTEKRLFFKGVSDALNQGVFDDKGRPIGATSRYDVLHLLHENYGDVLKCQNIIQLHAWVRRELDKKHVQPPSCEMFEKLCQEIGLTLTHPGQPAHR